MSEPEIIFIEHGGHRIACLAHENAAADRLPVVWMHGLTMSPRFWEAAMYQDIRDHRSWYSIGLPLHHPSTFNGELGDDTLDEELFAQVLATTIETLIPEGKFHLVGHSLGGFAALNYAAKFPQRVASVVSIGGFMTGRANGLEGMLQFLACGKRLRKALFHLGFRILKSHSFFLKLATLGYSKNDRALLAFRDLDPTLKNVFPDLQNHSIPAQRLFCRFLLEMDLLDEVDYIQAPVLFMVGEKDPVIPSQHQIECAERLPKGELKLFKECGHLTFAEAADEFEESLLEWLKRFDASNDQTGSHRRSNRV